MRYAETDKMGVVYYANYFVWFEVGRTDLLRHAGWSYREMEADGVALPVIEARCEYKQPARYDDELEILTKGTLLSPIRLAFDYEVMRTGDTTPIASGRTVHASLDRDGRPVRLPERVRNLFTAPAAMPARNAPSSGAGQASARGGTAPHDAGAPAAMPARNAPSSGAGQALAGGGTAPHDAGAPAAMPARNAPSSGAGQASARGGGAPRESK